MDSIQQLSGLILPDAISWWPVTSGWYVVIFLLCISLLIVIVNKRKRYIKNRYRRDALIQLQKITVSNATDLLTLLYHALLHTTSQQVELEQQVFLNALNKGLRSPLYDEQDWHLLKKFSFQSIDKHPSDGNKFSALKLKCEKWIKEHDYEHRA